MTMTINTKPYTIAELTADPAFWKLCGRPLSGEPTFRQKQTMQNRLRRLCMKKRLDADFIGGRVWVIYQTREDIADQIRKVKRAGWSTEAREAAQRALTVKRQQQSGRMTQED